MRFHVKMYFSLPSPLLLSLSTECVRACVHVFVRERERASLGFFNRSAFDL